VLPWSLACAAFVAGALYARRSGRETLEWLFKPAAAGCFLGLALDEGALETRYGTLMLAGFALAALGDVLLIPKSKRAFLAGLASFLLGHVAYAIAFAVRGVEPTWAAAAAVLLAIAVLPVMRWLWPHVGGKMRGPVIAYVVVITAMVALAAGTFGARADARILGGAIAFYLSDLAVARERFVAPGFVNRAWGLPLYFGAQLVLAWSVGG